MNVENFACKLYGDPCKKPLPLPQQRELSPSEVCKDRVVDGVIGLRSDASAKGASEGVGQLSATLARVNRATERNN